MPADPVHIPVFEGLLESRLPQRCSFTRGKVRDIVAFDSQMIITTSDRISAFDSVLGLVPTKGEVLNQISLYWFDKTQDIVPNHIISQLSARTVAVQRCEPLPVEVVVRGYLTGSAYRDYTAGRTVSGINLPSGMRFNEGFPEPLITPSTKAHDGTHDTPISEAEIVESRLIDGDLWRRVRETALRLFARGSAIAASRGLILVDTKYEFGLRDGELVLIDEVHTPDSSRYWYEDSYDELFAAGEKQRKLDKEYLRQWLMEQGYSGEGTPPEIPAEILSEVGLRYRDAFALITGSKLVPDSVTPEAETANVLSYIENA